MPTMQRRHQRTRGCSYRSRAGGRHRLDRDVIFREVKERFVDLEGRYSFSSPAESSKEGLLIQKIDGVAIAVQGGFNEMRGEVDGIRGGLGDVKGEVKGGFHEMKGGLDDVQEEVRGGFEGTKADLRDVKGEFKGGFVEMKASLRDVRDEMK